MITMTSAIGANCAMMRKLLTAAKTPAVKAAAIGLLAVAGLLVSPTHASQTDDCPLAHTPYSAQTPLLDLMLDPRAKAVLERDAPNLIADFVRPFGLKTISPGFAAILSPAALLKSHGDGQTLGKALDRDLAVIPITPAATLARCARYDNVRPNLPSVLKRPALLVFDKINGFRDQSSVAAAASALKGMAARNGWTIVFSDAGGVFNAHDLARFDAVVWNNVSGDALTLTERDAFKGWMHRGGGFAGIHGAGGDPFALWDWYADDLIGARFKGHPMTPQFQAARVIVADPGHGITRGMPPEWTMVEEWYSFEQSPQSNGAHVLASLDEKTYQPIGMGGQDLHMGDHPIAWTRCIGNGRSFYTAIGHRPDSYTEPNALKLLEQGIGWALGQGDTPCASGREMPRNNRAR